MKPWRRVEPTTKHKVGWLDITSKTFEKNGGGRYTCEIIAPEGQQEVAVVALTADPFVIIARQFRPGPEKIMDQLPGGGVEMDKDGKPKETLEVAARRELNEETGYRPDEITHIGTAHRSAYSNATSNYFFATGCTPSLEGPVPDEHEEIETRLITISQLFANAREGRMTDIAGVYFAQGLLLAIQRQLILPNGCQQL